MTQTFSVAEAGHIIASTLAVVLYIPVVTLAILRLLDKAQGWGRRWHMRLGITAFSFRSVGFVLMFTVGG